MSVFLTSAAFLLAAVPTCDKPLHIQHAERSANAHCQLHLLPESPQLKKNTPTCSSKLVLHD